MSSSDPLDQFVNQFCLMAIVGLLVVAGLFGGTIYFLSPTAEERAAAAKVHAEWQAKSVHPDKVPGKTVKSVSRQGTHCVIYFDDGTHMTVSGHKHSLRYN